MKRSQLEELVRELVRVAANRELAMIGSQCVHASTDQPPAEVLMSRECDVLVDESDPLAARIDAELGEGSPYYEEHGTFVDIVSPTFPFLPAGWEGRSRRVASSCTTSCCPS